MVETERVGLSQKRMKKILSSKDILFKTAVISTMKEDGRERFSFNSCQLKQHKPYRNKLIYVLQVACQAARILLGYLKHAVTESPLSIEKVEFPSDLETGDDVWVEIELIESCNNAFLLSFEVGYTRKGINSKPAAIGKFTFKRLKSN